MKMKKPETIENQWDILYSEYPEVYDAFAQIKTNPSAVDFIGKKFNLEGKTVIDIGSGSGASTFALVKYAKSVIGIEPEDAMRQIAETKARKLRLSNVRFLKGYAQKIPLQDSSVDAVIGITMVGIDDEENIKKFVNEAKRVVRNNGLIIYENTDSRWYGGEFASIILGKSRMSKDGTDYLRESVFQKLGFKHISFYSLSNYRTSKKMIETYGFIFGKKVIDYIKKHHISKVKWKFRADYREVKK